MMKDELKHYKNLQRFQKKCFICRSSNAHSSLECPNIHYIPNKDLILKKLTYACPQERLDISKYKRSNTRYKTLKKLYITQKMALKKIKHEKNGRNNVSSDFSFSEEEGSQLKLPKFLASEKIKTKAEVNKFLFLLSLFSNLLKYKVDEQKYSHEEFEHPSKIFIEIQEEKASFDDDEKSEDIKIIAVNLDIKPNHILFFLK